MEEFYTPINQVKSELEARWKNIPLRNKIEAFLGDKLPAPLKTSNRAVLVRCIASPDNEFFNFCKQAEVASLSPLLIEYPEDKFVAKNSDKYALCMPHFFDEKAKDYKQTPKIKLIDFNIYEGRKFKDVKTLWGNGLVSFHHEILKRSSRPQVEIFDFSDYFFSTRHTSDFYYLYYLGLFLCHGVLFENMLMSEEEKEFTLTKVLPSFKELQKMFGVKPLIVPVTPPESEDDFFWWTYPKELKNVTENYIKELESDNPKI